MVKSIGEQIEDRRVERNKFRNIDMLLYEKTYYSFRIQILKNTFLTVTDWIVVVCTLPSILIPTRTFTWFWIIYSHFTDYKRMIIIHWIIPKDIQIFIIY